MIEIAENSTISLEHKTHLKVLKANFTPLYSTYIIRNYTN